MRLAEIGASRGSDHGGLRVPAEPIAWILGALGAIMIAALRPPYDAPQQLRVFFVAVAAMVTAGVAAYLDRQGTIIGRWLLVIAFMALTYFGSTWLAIQEITVLLMIPAGLAAVLVSLPAGLATGLAATGLALAPSQHVASVGVCLTAVLAVWFVLGLLYATRQPTEHLAEWAQTWFEQSRELVREARDRRAELEQALQDLARGNQQLTRLNSLAQALRQRADEARAAKAQFVANVSHELRTPLNMIIGFSELILQTPDIYEGSIPPALLADLDVIHRNAEHLSRLVDDVLDLSRLDADSFVLVKEHTTLADLVADAATTVRPLFDSKGLVLRTDVAPSLPPVFCDRTRIQEAVVNLLSNAGRATKRGGASVRAWTEDGQAYVSVADTGPGIPPEAAGKLFQPFFQVDGSIRRRRDGAGLGLSISKRFIELHKGRIWVESQPGKGATFTFSLPLSPPQPLSDDFSRWLTPEWEFLERQGPSFAPRMVPGPRYVVVEPGDTLQRLLFRHLHEAEVVCTASLDEATAELRDTPSTALLVNDGTTSEVLDRLAACASLPEGTPAIICSIPGPQEASADLGVSDYLVKPVSREALIASLERVGVVEGTVLVVDDEPDALQLFGRMLAASGRDYRVLVARDGNEALDAFREHKPDVMLLDLVMPNMDGFRLLDARHHESALSNIPIIITSARDPMDQPIVSNALTVTREGGLSAYQMLATVRFLSAMLSAVPGRRLAGSDDRGLAEGLDG